MNFPTSFPWGERRRCVKSNFQRQRWDTLVVWFDKSLGAKTNNFSVLAPQRGEVHPRRTKEMTSSTRTAVDTGLWHQSDFIASGWASDIFLLLSFINYFLFKCFHIKIPQYFTLNTYTDFCCSPLQPIPHSGFFPSSRTTPHWLLFANSRVKSNFNNCSKTNNRSKPLTSPVLMVLCSAQNTKR